MIPAQAWSIKIAGNSCCSKILKTGAENFSDAHNGCYQKHAERRSQQPAAARASHVSQFSTHGELKCLGDYVHLNPYTGACPRCRAGMVNYVGQYSSDVTIVYWYITAAHTITYCSFSQVLLYGKGDVT